MTIQIRFMMIVMHRKWSAMYMSVRGIDCAFIYDLSIGFWNWSYSVVLSAILLLKDSISFS